MNIINCVSARVLYLQEKGYKVGRIHAQDNTYECIRVQKYEEKLHYSFYILAESITCSFDRFFNNKKDDQNDKGDADGSEKPLI